MPRANLPINGDNIYTEKVKRIQKLTPETESKIDWIPGVVNGFDSTSTTDALSAAAGRLLQDQINELKSRGRFLSTWDCTTWLPDTDPVENPHYYATWDYYIIGKVGSTNYRPHWDRYEAWVASTTIETAEVKKNDQYLYDWQNWVVLSQTEIELTIDQSLSTTSTNAVENRVITNAINTKQNVISDLATIRAWASAWATAIQPWDNISELTNNVWFQTAWDVANAIAGKANTSDLNTLTTRVSTAEWTIVSQWQAITALQQWQWGSEQDISDLQWDVSSLQTSVWNLQTTLAGKADASSLSTVATSWKASDLDNDAWFITANYVGNWQITVKQWAANKWSFTLNQSWAANIQLERAYTISQAEYSQLGTPDADTTYFITDGTPASQAEFITYPTTQEVNKAIADAIDDTAYSSSWDWDTTHAPSKNAVYDKIENINSVPTWWTEWQVLTKTADWYWWMANMSWLTSEEIAEIKNIILSWNINTFSWWVAFCSTMWTEHSNSITTIWTSWNYNYTYTAQWYWYLEVQIWYNDSTNHYANRSYLTVNWRTVFNPQSGRAASNVAAWWILYIQPWDSIDWETLEAIWYVNIHERY